MPHEGHKTPPHIHTHVIMRSLSDINVTLETTTSSNDNPNIPVEPMTPLPEGIFVQEIVRQSLIRTHSSLSHIRNDGRQLNQPLELQNFKNNFKELVFLKTL
jgi:hypothetical protein